MGTRLTFNREGAYAENQYTTEFAELGPGEAIRLAKRDLAGDPKYRPLLETWILLGDPATRIGE